MIRAMLVCSLLFVGCADKIQGARTAVIFGKAATEMTESGFTSALTAKTQACKIPICKKLDPSQGRDYQNCMGRGHGTNPEWQKCMTEMMKALAVWQKTKPTLAQAWKTAEATINAAAQAKSGTPIDYMTPVKDAACMLVFAAEFLPKDWKAKIQKVLDMMSQFGCVKKAPLPFPLPRK